MTRRKADSLEVQTNSLLRTIAERILVYVAADDKKSLKELAATLRKGLPRDRREKK